jgi:hypothetical protein
VTRKKTPVQLDREIAGALSRPKIASARKLVADVAARSPDAEFILEGEEFDLPWTEEQCPLSWFRFAGVGTLEDYSHLPLDKDDLERMETIEQWAQSRGGLSRALRESPILAWDDGTVLDGTHRLLVAKRHGLRAATTLLAPRPSWDL